MNAINRKTLVRSIRGSAAQILLAFLFHGKAMDVAEIKSWTNLKRETIYDGLKVLEGFIVKADTLAHGRELWAPAEGLLPAFQPLIDETQESVFWTPDPLIVVESKGEDPVPSNLTITISKDQESVKRTSAQQADLDAALKEFGIIGKKRANLIAADWVTGDYVRAHCDHAMAEGWDQPIGMAIYMMEAQAPAPAVRTLGSNKYTGGQYGHMIEH